MHPVLAMRPIATDVTRSVVCVSVDHTDVPCKNGWTDRDAVWGLTRVGLKNHVLDEVKIGRIHLQPSG